jgi:hypothetical protein
MERREIERRLERIERLLKVTAEETARLRVSLGIDMSSNDRWGRMMYGVLDDLDRKGGEVQRRAFLELGEKHGYNHRGMAGFYHVLVEPTPQGKTRLTEAGRARLDSLRDRYAF